MTGKAVLKCAALTWLSVHLSFPHQHTCWPGRRAWRPWLPRPAPSLRPLRRKRVHRVVTRRVDVHRLSAQHWWFAECIDCGPVRQRRLIGLHCDPLPLSDRFLTIRRRIIVLFRNDLFQTIVNCSLNPAVATLVVAELFAAASSAFEIYGLDASEVKPKVSTTPSYYRFLGSGFQRRLRRRSHFAGA